MITLETVDSTNNYALHLLQSGRPTEGTLISAHHQYQGRGQKDTIWEASKGKNITISLILYPKYLLAHQQFYLNQCISLGVYHFAQSILGDGVCIKWPNDIYYNDKKLGGILIENTIYQHYLSASVIGIGLNVNQTAFDASLPNPTSLKLLTQQTYSVTELVQKLCWHIEVQYLQLKADKLSLLKTNYLQSLFRFGKFSYYKIHKELIYGCIVDVTPQGKLVLEFEREHTYWKREKATFDIKEIEFVL